VGQLPKILLDAGTLAWDDSADGAPWRATLPIGAAPAWWLSLQLQRP
jgi:hypothetical protein